MCERPHDFGWDEFSATTASPAPTALTASSSPAKDPRPAVPAEAHEVFFPAFNRASGVTYHPGVYARAKLHFVDKKGNVDVWRTVECWVPVAPTDADPRWATAESVPQIVSAHVVSAPLAESRCEPLPPSLRIAKNHAAFRKAFAQHLYQSEALVSKHVKALALSSLADETPEQFTARLEQAVREKRDQEMEDLQDDYRDAFEQLKAKLDKAVGKLERERRQSASDTVDVALAVGGGLLGALLGRKVVSQANVQRVRSATRRGARAARKRVDIEQAEQSRELLERAMADLEREFREESAQLAAEWRLENQTIEERRITPRKADTLIETLQLAWRPD
jgi:hypothetical protein